MPGANAIAVRSVTVTFGRTRALDGVSLDIRSGEVLALLGGNGSGKSTLIKVLAGVQTARPGGTLVLGDEAVATERHSPATARAHGLRFVHQHPGLFGDLTVAENLAVGHGYPTTVGGAIAWRTLKARAREVLERFHLDIAPDAIVEHLRPAQQMMISIARALQDQEPGRGALVLDEPTAALPVAEANELLTAVRRYAQGGTTIIYVSHRLSEILAVADRAVVLRDGRVAGEYPRDAITEQILVEAIVGRRPAAAAARAAAPTADDGRAPLLELRDVSAGPLRGITLSARRNEVTGLAGLVGSGRSSLLRAVFGVQPPAAGTVQVDGRPLKAATPSAAMRAGVAYLPEDRAREAAFADLSVRENLSAADLRRYWKKGWLRRAPERADARTAIAGLAIRSASAEAPVATLSGGNQQKVMISRWLRRSPRLLLLDEPTQGVDVGARQEIHRVIRGTVDAGSAALLVSSDFEELAAVCDRVYVLAGGRLVREVAGGEIDAQRLGELAHLGVAA